MAKRVMPQLGQEAFQVSREGNITRTMVAKVYAEGGWQFLNGSRNALPCYFSFEEAVAAAEGCIKTHEARLREELRALARKRKSLRKPDCRNHVMTAPYRVIDLREVAYPRKPSRPRNLRKVIVPKTYLLPGHRAYTIITPGTESVSEAYRPVRFFVLEVEVRSVCFTPDGHSHYSFSTPFVVKDIFPSEQEAALAIRELLDLRPVHSVWFVSRKEEQEWFDNQPDDTPF